MNFNSDPRFFNLVKLGKISSATHFFNCANIGRNETIAAIILGFSNFLSGRRFVMLTEGFQNF